jgi:hypothetical protein
MQDLQQSLNKLFDLLHAALTQIGKRGEEYALAEADYRSELSKRMLERKTEGIAATILSDVCRGEPDIANLKFQRDCAEAKYKAALEAVNVYKLKIKSLEAQIEREWKG